MIRSKSLDSNNTKITGQNVGALTRVGSEFYSLGVDGSVGVVKGSDDVVGKPGACHNATQTC